MRVDAQLHFPSPRPPSYLSSCFHETILVIVVDRPATGMASPLLGIAGVNSLLFAAYVASKRIVSPFPDLSIPQVALAGGMAGAVNAILASPGGSSAHGYQCCLTSCANRQSRCSKLGCKVSMALRATNSSGPSQRRCGENGVSQEGS